MGGAVWRGWTSEIGQDRKFVSPEWIPGRLIHRDIDRQASRQPRLLSIEGAELRGAVAKTLCWVYCESKFPAAYAVRAAALAEMSLDQFKQYERDRRPLMRDMGLLR
jgi:hypothetical protein